VRTSLLQISLLSSVLFFGCHNPEELTIQNNPQTELDSTLTTAPPNSINTTSSSGEITNEGQINKDSVKVVNPTGVHHGSENQHELDSIKNEKLKKKN
jgi:hypothetical protein